VPHITFEVGELHPGGAGGGKGGIGILTRWWETLQMPRNLNKVSTVQQRIAHLVQRSPDFAFTSLAHHIDLQWLEEAYNRTRKDGSAGIDDVTGKQYAEHLHDNLQNLLYRLKSGTYKAPPVKRKHIPKGTSGDTRPIGIPTFEDKIVQRAVVMLLEPIYEHDFHDGSFGFRPKRSAHQALEEVRNATMEVNGGWVLEVDIQKFFDTLDHQHLREFVSRRVRDGVLRRLIDKWLKAGVMEDGELAFSNSGTPQGGVISPILANIYLHYVLDEWFEKDVKPVMRGKCHLIRFADDFVIIFQLKYDADRVMNVISKRFGKYGLTVHPEKTKLIDFRSPNHYERRREEKLNGNGRSVGKPQTFDLLGFTHYWGRTLKGNWAVKRKTMKSRIARTVQGIDQWCRENRHSPIKEQWKTLCEKVRGHYAYYGITGNIRSLGKFRHQVYRCWHRWLDRRNRKRRLNGKKFYLLLIARLPLPTPKIVHSFLKGKR
jgi:group II intron reverse transcriptase/maturase